MAGWKYASAKQPLAGLCHLGVECKLRYLQQLRALHIRQAALYCTYGDAGLPQLP
jgi:hypothetical protein